MAGLEVGLMVVVVRVMGCGWLACDEPMRV